MDLQLAGKVAVVTGASKGIGLAVTETLVEEGARVVAASRTPTAALEALADRVVHVAVDLRDPAGPAEAIACAVEAFGGLDILVNNAGGPVDGSPLPHDGFLGRTDADWQRIVDFNLGSAVRACRAALPLMIERGGGVIVNVSSANARQPAPVNVDYSVAKAALSCLTQALAEEFGPSGVRVNTVSPGPVLTPWWTDEGGAADRFAAMVGADRDAVLTTVGPELMALTTGRFVSAQEVADVIVHLASPRAASTTGADHVVDGGLLKTV